MFPNRLQPYDMAVAEIIPIRIDQSLQLANVQCGQSGFQILGPGLLRSRLLLSCRNQSGRNRRLIIVRLVWFIFSRWRGSLFRRVSAGIE